MRPYALLLPLMLALACGTPATTSPPPAADQAAGAPAHGQQVVPTKDGGRMEGLLVNGKRQGAWASYFPDGALRSRTHYEAGVEEGPTEVYHPNGTTYYTGRYRHGKAVGEWLFYNEDGVPVKRAMYDSLGVLVEQKGL
jgi:hypothetical protein